jgi:hypothetical protein
MTSPEIIAKAAEALAESVASIINDPCATEQEKREALAVSFAQAECFLKEELPVEALAKSVIASANPAIAFENADGTRMTFPHKRALAMWLAIQRVTKTEKEPNMDPLKNLHDFVQAGRLADIAKVLVADGDAHSISENEFTELVMEHAKREYPSLSPAQAFAKVFEEDELLRKAHAVTKSMPFQVDLTPLFVGGDAAHDVGDPSEAIAQLQELGRQKWPTASEAQQFANAFGDPANAKLAAQAHQRPRPTTQYPFPR